MKDIGLEIRNLIYSKQISKIELSKQIGKSTRSLYNYLENKTPIDVITLQKIADVFEVPISYFFDEHPNPIENKQKSDVLLEKIKFLDGLIFIKDDKTKEIIRLFTSIIEFAEFEKENLLNIKPYLYIFLHIIDVYYKKTLALELEEEIKTIKKKFKL